MNGRKKLLLAAVVSSLILIMIAAGCGAETVPAKNVNPINKEEIGVITINKGSSYQEKFTDKDTISEIIDNLDNVKVKQLSRAEDKRVLDSGNALKKESTITLYLSADINSEPQSMVILLSEKELYLPDVKSMHSSNYTESYINDSDETTLESIKAIYSLVEEITEKFPDKVLGQLNNDTAYCYVVSSDVFILKKDIPELLEILHPENWKSSGEIANEKTRRDIVINFNEFPEGKNEQNFDYNMGTLVVRQLAIQKEPLFVYDGYSTKGELYSLSSDTIKGLEAFIDQKTVSHDELISKMNTLALYMPMKSQRVSRI